LTAILKFPTVQHNRLNYLATPLTGFAAAVRTSRRSNVLPAGAAERESGEEVMRRYRNGILLNGENVTMALYFSCIKIQKIVYRADLYDL
jgi:hypothetical protein